MMFLTMSCLLPSIGEVEEPLNVISEHIFDRDIKEVTHVALLNALGLKTVRPQHTLSVHSTSVSYVRKVERD